jgi:transcriptional regulator PpsR
MEALVPRDAVNPFRSPRDTLGDLKADVAAAVISAAADVALVVDREGVIRDLSYAGDTPPVDEAGAWIGRPWIDTVTVESRAKIAALLDDARAGAKLRWRQVNHPVPGGADIPVRYSAVEIREGGFVAVGRDLRALARLQQRLIDAQLAIERDYARLRQAETRYRLLFQLSSEAVLIVDAASGKVTDGNPAAVELLARGRKTLVGKAFIDLFDPSNDNEVRAFLATARSGLHPEDVSLRVRGGTGELLVSASLFRQDNSIHLLVQIEAPDVAEAVAPPSRAALVHVVESMPDGFVVAGLDGRILTANTAFLELAELASEEQAIDQPLDRWIGRSGVDLDVLLSKLLEHSFVRNFASVVRGEYGGLEEIELSAVAVRNGKQPCFGFTIRKAGLRPLRAGMLTPHELPRSAEELTELVGRVSLRDLVRETTDLIERLYIEAALKLTGDNRASAAEMLGLSRQSLYVKLRRYGLGDLSHENDG